MSLRDALLPLAESIRTLPGLLDARPTTVQLVTLEEGPRAARGESDTSFTVISNLMHQGQYAPRVVEVSQEDVNRSGGKVELQDLRISGFTPEFDGGGFSLEDLNPEVPTGGSQTVYVRIEGAGYSSPALFRIIGVNTSRALGWSLFIRRI